LGNNSIKWDGSKMKDSRGKEIFIGDRVKVLCNFDNKIHEGDVFRVDRKHIEVDIPMHRISVYNHKKITKLHETKKKHR
jgi:hypothetical protein